jgi:hypothetical protein
MLRTLIVAFGAVVALVFLTWLLAIVLQVVDRLRAADVTIEEAIADIDRPLFTCDEVARLQWIAAQDARKAHQ